jgi:hypothetical protein
MPPEDMAIVARRLCYGNNFYFLKRLAFVFVWLEPVRVAGLPAPHLAPI